MSFVILMLIFLGGATPTEYLDSAQIENYYPEGPISALPAQTQFQFTKMLNILIQPNARRSKLFSSGFLNCEIVSESNNTAQLRVSLPKTVTSTQIISYHENRTCIESRIPIPESLDSATFNGNCQVQGAFIVNMTAKCYAAVLEHDNGNPLWTTNVTGTSDNPRLFATAGLYERLDKACKKDTQTIEIDFEGELKMVCYDSWGTTKMSDLVKNIETAFGIKIQVPAPSNLQEIDFRRPSPASRPPISI
jgi:hypothetical protein